MKVIRPEGIQTGDLSVSMKIVLQFKVRIFWSTLIACNGSLSKLSTSTSSALNSPKRGTNRQNVHTDKLQGQKKVILPRQPFLALSIESRQCQQYSIVEPLWFYTLNLYSRSIHLLSRNTVAPRKTNAFPIFDDCCNEILSIKFYTISASLSRQLDERKCRQMQTTAVTNGFNSLLIKICSVR